MANKPKKEKETEEAQNLSLLQKDVDWIQRSFWAIAGVYAFVFLGAISFFWTEIKEISNSVSDLKVKIGRMEKESETLSQNSQKFPIALLEATLPTHREYRKLPERDLVSRLERASNIVEAHVDSGIPANQVLLANIKKNSYVEIQRPDLPQSVRDAGISVLVRLEMYELFGRVYASRVPIILLPPDKVSEQSTPLVAGQFPVVISGVAGVLSTVRGTWASVLEMPRDAKRDILRLIYTLPNEAENVMFRDIRAENFVQPIDGFKWFRIEFVNSVIRYRGGPLYLADVRFRNCLFEFGTDEASQAALRKIRAAGEQPVTILLPPRTK